MPIVTGNYAYGADVNVTAVDLGPCFITQKIFAPLLIRQKVDRHHLGADLSGAKTDVIASLPALGM